MSVYESLPDFQEGRLIARGTIASNPATLEDKVWVLLPDFDGKLRWGPCKWQSRDAVSLPARGDACLVIMDNTREPWVVAWWPF